MSIGAWLGAYVMVNETWYKPLLRHLPCNEYLGLQPTPLSTDECCRRPHCLGRRWSCWTGEVTKVTVLYSTLHTGNVV